MKMYMTIEEVAQSLRVTVPTVRWLRQEGRFAPAIKVGGECCGMRRLSRIGLRRTEKRRPGEYPTEGHAARQGPLPGAHQSEWSGGRFSDV
jgi:excisionase family DNA binding protein